MSVVTHVHVDGHYDPDAKILISQPKSTAAGQSFPFGQTLVYDVATDKWEKAVSGSVGKFGFCTNPEFLTLSTNELTGAVTSTRGVAEADTAASVLVEGTVEKMAEGVINPGAYVKVAATDPNKVSEWVGSPTPEAENLIVGRYVINLTQHHNANEPPLAAADGDSIKIKVQEVQVI